METVIGRLVEKHYGFLVDEYGFPAPREDYVQTLYNSPRCRVRFFEDRMQVFIELGQPLRESDLPFPRPRSPYLLNAPARWAGVADIMALKDPNSDWAPRMDFDAYRADREGFIESELVRYAPHLRHYCDEVLRADFSILVDRGLWKPLSP